MKFKEAVTYDDMLLVPQYSDIESRSEVDISNRMGHRELKIPILASPMDTVSGDAMAIAMYRAGGKLYFIGIIRLKSKQRWLSRLLK